MNPRDDIVAYLVDKADALCEDPGNPGNFIELDMFYDADCDDDLIRRIVDCPKLSRLQSIRIPEANITDEAIMHLSKLADLEYLDCNTTKVTDAGIKYLSQARNLEVLHISETSAGDVSAHLVGKLPRLRELAMGSTRLTDEGCEGLGHSPSITHLFIGRNELSDACVPFLEKIATLEFLDLTATRVTSGAVTVLRNRGVQM